MTSVMEAFSHTKMIEIEKRPPVSPDLRSLLLSNPFVQALWIRVAYGGMSGDQAMLTGLAQRSEGFSDNILATHSKDEGIIPPSTFSIRSCDYGPLRPCDILEVSKDFHVYPKILETLSGSLGVDPNQIKLAIWCHASGVTFRKSLDGTLLDREVRFEENQKRTKDLWKMMIEKGVYKI